MGFLLDFQFVVILNLLICIAWPATGPYIGARTTGARWEPLYIIMVILTVIAIVLDIVFLAGGHAH